MTYYLIGFEPDLNLIVAKYIMAMVKLISYFMYYKGLSAVFLRVNRIDKWSGVRLHIENPHILLLGDLFSS